MKRWGQIQQTTRKTLKFDILPQYHIKGSLKRSILIYHNPCHKWNSKMTSQNDSLEPKVSRYNFFHFWPLFINNSWKRSILIYRNRYGIWNFEMSPPKRLNWAQMSWKWAGNIFSSFWPHFIYGAVKLSILMCHTTDFIWNF